MKVVIVLLCFCVAAALAAPPAPLWPAGWSATIEYKDSFNPQAGFFRWFWDSRMHKDRVDGISQWHDEYYYAERIFDHAKGTEYAIFFQPGTVNCFTRPINTTMPQPNFSNLRYIGNATVGYQPAFHWFYDDAAMGRTWQVYDRQDNRELLRIDVSHHRNRRAESFTFWEFSAGVQDATLFDVPAQIADQCNAITAADF
eukprot:TRINITY_DN229_c0_g1_i1.p1 TRINITY_DN229_c0_g1~~TRINITY_DN229_c0_g1_i1.p1  ORF type:complete len:199 (-),score=24.61 TRINITY_DN229_c0_g1_i1:100-696(-)